MRIGLLQVATLLGQPIKNRVCIESYLHKLLAEKIDVVMFPETWNVGFIPENVLELAEDVSNCQSLQWMKEMAKKHKINIVGGSIAIKEQDQLFNRSYVINREGEVIHHYDKAHLFSPGQESTFFSAGEKNQIFELDGIPCAVQI